MLLWIPEEYERQRGKRNVKWSVAILWESLFKGRIVWERNVIEPTIYSHLLYRFQLCLFHKEKNTAHAGAQEDEDDEPLDKQDQQLAELEDEGLHNTAGI